MDLLRIATSGSVDDGKSTLIGRLLYETGQVPADRLVAIAESSKRRGLDFTDLSLLTDGLIAEREQGITIDVAHIYFATEKRKYIIADTPGHEEYTRNMVTGASQCDAAIVLIDARNGVVRQTRRHFYIATLLELPHIVVAVNKMDLVNYRPDAFEQHRQAILELAEQFDYRGRLHFHPISALAGEGISKPSGAMDWYDGPSLLDTLESIDANDVRRGDVRFQVQQVIRPRMEGLEDYRGYAGVLNCGELNVGDELLVGSNRQPVRVKGLEKFGTPLEQSGPSLALTVHLDEDVDLPRGEWLLGKESPEPTSALNARITWLNKQSLQVGGRYLLQHGTSEVQCKVDAVLEVLDMDDLQARSNLNVGVNDIAQVKLRTQKALPFEPFSFRSRSGSFILVDPGTRDTVAVGMVVSA